MRRVASPSRVTTDFQCADLISTSSLNTSALTGATNEPDVFHARACFSPSSLTNYNPETACMDGEHIADLVHQLNDVELAVLLSLVARKHCILTTEPECLDLLRQQIELVSVHLKSWGASLMFWQLGPAVFGLTVTVVRCASDTTLDDFIEPLLLDDIRLSPTSHGISPVNNREVVQLFAPRLL